MIRFEALDVDGRDRTMLDVAIGQILLRGRDLPAGRPARRVWLEPLPARVTLARLLEPPGMCHD